MIPGADVTGRLLEVKRQDISGIIMTLTDQRPRTEISGTILTDNREPAPEYLILIYSSDEKYWTSYSRRVYAIRANENGTFVMKGLPPGDYRVATLLDAQYGVWFESSYLHRIDADAMAVSIAGDEKKELNLRVPGDR